MKVAVVEGGPSAEAEVSRASAACVCEALGAQGHMVSRLELGPGLPSLLLEFAPDVVFPAAHGNQGEDGCLQGLLEVLRLPFVGSDVRGSALAADKITSKTFFRLAGLQVARERIFSVDEPREKASQRFASLKEELGPCLIVKPARGGSTLGMSRILEGDGREAFSLALEAAFVHDPKVLVEELIEGKEYTCSVVEEGGKLRALPVTLIESKAANWYDFESKYASGGSVHRCPAPIDAGLTRSLQDAAVKAHQILGLRDLSRTDFIVNPDGEPILLESNTLPGMTRVSLFPEAVRAEGGHFGELLNRLVLQAEKRIPTGVTTAEPLPGG